MATRPGEVPYLASALPVVPGRPSAGPRGRGQTAIPRGREYGAARDAISQLEDTRMSKGSIMALVLAGVLATTVAPVRAEKKSKDFEKGQAFCPSHVLVIGGTIIQAGRRFMLAGVRNDHGTFLAFLNPAGERAPGAVRLQNEDGRPGAAKGIYPVPIGAAGVSAAGIPLNTGRVG